MYDDPSEFLPAQLLWKLEWVREALVRNGHIEPPPLNQDRPYRLRYRAVDNSEGKDLRRRFSIILGDAATARLVGVLLQFWRTSANETGSGRDTAISGGEAGETLPGPPSALTAPEAETIPSEHGKPPLSPDELHLRDLARTDWVETGGASQLRRERAGAEFDEVMAKEGWGGIWGRAMDGYVAGAARRRGRPRKKRLVFTTFTPT